MSKVCSKCNTRNPDNAHYCARCGAPLEKMFGILDVEYIVVKKSDYDSLVNQRTSLRRENQRLQEQVASSWTTKMKNLFNSDFVEEVKTVFYFIVSTAIFIFLAVWVYNSCSKSDTIEIVEKNSKYGLYDNKLDKQVQPFVYDSISYQNKNNENYYCLYKGGKIGLADSTGVTRLECVADSVVYVGHGLMRLFAGGKQGVADIYANIILPCNFYRTIGEVTSDSWYSFDEIGGYVGNIIPVKETLYSNWDLYNRSGKKVTKTKFSSATQTGHSNLIKVSPLYNSYKGLIDVEGKTVLTFEYKVISLCSNNRIWVKNRKANSSWDCVDETGAKKFSIPGRYTVYLFFDGLSAVMDTGGSLGYVDINGKYAIPMKYRRAKRKDGTFYSPSFYNGRAIVSDGKSNGRIDKNGNFTKDESLN